MTPAMMDCGHTTCVLSIFIYKKIIFYIHKVYGDAEWTELVTTVVLGYWAKRMGRTKPKLGVRNFTSLLLLGIRY
jgi:hypothetical protein